MATDTLRAESAHHNPLTFTLSPGMAPAAPLMHLLARFDRQKVEAFAEVSIALLDLLDGDPDLDGQNTEDEISVFASKPSYGAGCEISDPGGCQHDGREPEESVLCRHYGIEQTNGPVSI